LKLFVIFCLSCYLEFQVDGAYDFDVDGEVLVDVLVQTAFWICISGRQDGGLSASEERLKDGGLLGEDGLSFRLAAPDKDCRINTLWNV